MLFHNPGLQRTNTGLSTYALTQPTKVMLPADTDQFHNSKETTCLSSPTEPGTCLQQEQGSTTA